MSHSEVHKIFQYPKRPSAGMSNETFFAEIACILPFETLHDTLDLSKLYMKHGEDTYLPPMVWLGMELDQQQAKSLVKKEQQIKYPSKRKRDDAGTYHNENGDDDDDDDGEGPGDSFVEDLSDIIERAGGSWRRIRGVTAGPEHDELLIEIVPLMTNYVRRSEAECNALVEGLRRIGLVRGEPKLLGKRKKGKEKPGIRVLPLDTSGITPFRAKYVLEDGAIELAGEER